MTFEEILAHSKGKIDYPIICPFHVQKKHDGSYGPESFPSCRVNLEKAVFHCFGCGMKGSFVKMKVLLEGGTYEEAKWDLYGKDIPPHVLRMLEGEDEEEEPIYPESLLALCKPAGAIEERGIEEDEARTYGLLRDAEGDLYIPIRCGSGLLRGSQVRYRQPSTEQTYNQVLWFRRGKWLYGEHLIPKEPVRLIICEGALDAVKLYGVLGNLAVATIGRNLTPEQKEKLLRWNIKEVVLWYDNDTTGKNAAIANYKLLKKSFAGEIYAIRYEEGDKKDPCAEREERIKELWQKRTLFPLVGLASVTPSVKLRR